LKTVNVVFCARDFCGEWQYPFDENTIAPFFSELNSELSGCGVLFKYEHQPNITLRINGYGDLLNSIRVNSKDNGLSSLCLGQIIGCSPDADLFADLKRGVRRVAFSPESIPPPGGDELCHNCGCGC